MSSHDNKIRWTPAEFNKVAREWIRICESTATKQDPLNPRSFSRVAAEAQLVLDSNRHRPKHSLAGTKNIRPIFEEVKRLVKIKAQAAESNKTVPPSLAPSQVEIKPSSETPKQTNEPLESLVRAFGQQVAGLLVGEVLVAIRSAFNAEFPKLYAKTISISRVLPKILITGPLSKQQMQLEEAVKGVADLKFVASDESPRLVITRGQNCIAVIVWSNFTSHAHQEAARRLFDSQHLRIVTGGLEVLEETCVDLALSIK